MGDSWYDYDEYLQPRHLKGRRVTLTIERASEVRVDERGAKRNKPVLYFKGTAKYLFLNKTMRLALCEMFGEHPSACVGKKIAIQAIPLEGRKDGKETIAIYRAAEVSPSAPLPKTEFVLAPQLAPAGGEPPSEAAEVKFDVDRMWDVLTFHEIEQPEMVIKRALEHAKGDHAAALAALEEKYGAVPATATKTSFAGGSDGRT